MGKQKCIKTTSVFSPTCSLDEFKSHPCFSTAVLSLLAANFSQGSPLQGKMKRKLWKDVSHSFPKPFIFSKFLSQLPNAFSGSITIPAHRMETQSGKQMQLFVRKSRKLLSSLNDLWLSESCLNIHQIFPLSVVIPLKYIKNSFMNV